MAAKQKKESNAPAADEADTGADLVTLVKDGETIDVDPSCIADHKRVGWAEA